MNRRWHLAHGRTLDLGDVGLVMGILNVTPDSFSDGGEFDGTDAALAQADRMILEGAAIIDIGGESTRPGAEPVSVAEEWNRIMPVIESLSRKSDAIISVDTYRAKTARLAIEAGAHIINDVWGLQREPAIADVAHALGAGVVIMHTGREREKHLDVIEDQKLFFSRSLEIARAAGIADTHILLDPGFGFAKDPDENLALMARFAELQQLGYPLLAGTSRKRFLGAVTGRDDFAERDVATAATTALLRLAGASVFRVHDVAASIDALRVTEAMLARRGAPPTMGG